MQIIYAHTVDIGKPSTAINFVFYNGLALARQGVTVHLIMTNSGSEDAKTILQRHFNEELPQNLHIHAYQYKQKEHYNLYKITLQKTRELLTPNTIFITRTIGILPHLFLFSRLGYKMNVFFELHDFFYSLKLKNAPIKNIIPYKKRFYERHFMKHAKGLICLNQAYKDLYNNYFPEEKLHVFHTGINKIVTPETKRRNEVTYIGSVDNNKYAIEDIFKVAAYTDSSVRFNIIGGQNEEQIGKLKEFATKHNVEKQVNIIPWTTREKINEILVHSKIGLLALRSTFSNRHSIPLKLMDYYSHGLPVLAPKYKSFYEIIEEGKHGFFVNWESDHKEIASKINMLVNDESTYNTMSSEVYKQAKKLTWEERARKQIETFSQFLNQQNSSNN